MFFSTFLVFLATLLREIAGEQLFSCENIAAMLQNSSVSLIELANSSCVYEIRDMRLDINHEIKLISFSETAQNSIKLINSSLFFNKNTSISHVKVDILTGSQKNAISFSNLEAVQLQVY